MKTKNKKQKTKNYNLKIKIFLFLIVVLAFGFLVFKIALADVPVREQQLIDGGKGHRVWPVWVEKFDKCTDYQTSLEKFIGGLTLKTSELEYKSQRQAQMRDIQKAREDVNKLVATVYNELRTQQIALNYGELRSTLQSLGIVVSDDNSEEMCKSAYHVKAKIGDDEQCVAVAQEARIITNSDDFIYEEPRRRAMDGLFCYLGDWRHFPIASVNDPANCEAVGLPKNCASEEIWKTLSLTDIDGNTTPIDISDDQHTYNLCEGMRAKGKKCAQDQLRDYIKYSTIDKITRKDRTIILAPPATWYTPTRCQIIESTLPVAGEPIINFKPGTPYTKRVKSLQVTDPDKLNSLEFLDYYTGSKFGNPTVTKQPSDMSADEYTVEKEMQTINVPENGFPGLAAKAETFVNRIIDEMTELRKLQYTSGDGLRDATLRIGWQDYEWDADGVFLEKYKALDSPPTDPKKPNKIYEPLPCYYKGEWMNGGSGLSALCDAGDARATARGKTFYFDTGIVISPISITKSKLDSAIKAQFDLAQKAFSDNASSGSWSLSLGECGINLANPDYSLHSLLPAPWEDTAINLASAVNPLTGEAYTTGTPGKLNPSFRIPNLPNNYFNVIYNDVFQLYHTSVPDSLARWFRLNEPDYDSIYGLGEPIDILAAFGPGGGGSHGPSPLPSLPGEPPPPPPSSPTGPLPRGCDSYQSNFTAVAAQQGVDTCLLRAIASAESTCNPNAQSGHGACGLMQILPKTASALAGRTVTCDELKSNPQLSIELAAKLFNKSRIILEGYKASHGFDIGNLFAQTNQTVSFGNKAYDKGNDDLIASYNAGYGDGKKSNGQSMPFYPSKDCPNPSTPSWQCNINPGGFAETQTYVQRVQNYQDQCMGS